MFVKLLNAFGVVASAITGHYTLKELPANFTAWPRVMEDTQLYALLAVFLLVVFLTLSGIIATIRLRYVGQLNTADKGIRLSSSGHFSGHQSNASSRTQPGDAKMQTGARRAEPEDDLMSLRLSGGMPVGRVSDPLKSNFNT